MHTKQAFHIGRHRQQARPNTSWLYINVALALVLIVAGVGTLFWMGQQSSSDKINSSNRSFQHQEQTAPDFRLTSLSSETVHLSDYAGQIVLINFWATWCPPCRAEMPAINAFYEAHKEAGFVVLAVNSQEEAATVERFIQANSFSFPVLLDLQASAMDRYQVRGLPTTFIIDRDGFIQHVQTGEITPEQLEAVVVPLL
jgi:peroxiredoxin